LGFCKRWIKSRKHHDPSQWLAILQPNHQSQSPSLREPTNHHLLGIPNYFDLFVQRLLHLRSAFLQFSLVKILLFVLILHAQDIKPRRKEYILSVLISVYYSWSHWCS
jgi:hypothetical protein